MTLFRLEEAINGVAQITSVLIKLHDVVKDVLDDGVEDPTRDATIHLLPGRGERVRTSGTIDVVHQAQLVSYGTEEGRPIDMVWVRHLGQGPGACSLEEGSERLSWAY